MTKGQAQRRKGARTKVRALPPSFHQGLSEAIIRQWRDQRPDIARSSFMIGTMVTRLAILLQQLRISVRDDDDELRSSAFNLLYALRRVGAPYAQRPTGLYRLLGITSGAVSYTIRILKKRGLIEVVPDPDDGRSHLIRLTAQGLALVDGDVGKTAQMMELACGSLTDDQREAIVDALITLARSWEDLTDRHQEPVSS